MTSEALEPAQQAPLTRYLERTEEYARRAKARNTWKAYESDWKIFMAWCREHDRRPLPADPETVAAYFVHMVDELGRKVSTVERHGASIAQMHRAVADTVPEAVPPPTEHWMVRQVLRGIRRVHGTAPDEKAPLFPEDLRRMISTLDLASNRGLQTRALLLIGWAGAFRRSEVVTFDWEHDREVADGLVLRLPWAKTDQEGKGTDKAVPYGKHEETCPVLALRAWRAACTTYSGPIFRSIDRWDRVLDSRLSDRGVARAVQSTAKRAGVDGAAYAGHSLRAGLSTSAARAGAPTWVIRKQTGHKSDRMLERYIRLGGLFTENAVSYTDL